MALTTRVCDLPFVGVCLKGQKERARRFVPSPNEGWDLWRHYLGENFVYSSANDIIPPPEQKEQILRLFRRILFFQGKDRLIVKLTGPPRIKFLRRIFPEAHFVHILRDPRAVIHSQLKVERWRPGGNFENPWWNDLPQDYCEAWRDSGKPPIVLLAYQLRNIMEQVRQEGSLLPPRQFFEIRYEDFIRDVSGRTRDILRSCGLELHPRIIRYLQRVEIRSQNHKWPRHLGTQDVIIIEKIFRDIRF